MTEKTKTMERLFNAKHSNYGEAYIFKVKNLLEAADQLQNADPEAFVTAYVNDDKFSDRTYLAFAINKKHLS